MEIVIEPVYNPNTNTINENCRLINIMCFESVIYRILLMKRILYPAGITPPARTIPMNIVKIADIIICREINGDLSILKTYNQTIGRSGGTMGSPLHPVDFYNWKMFEIIHNDLNIRDRNNIRRIVDSIGDTFEYIRVGKIPTHLISKNILKHQFICQK